MGLGGMAVAVHWGYEALMLFLLSEQDSLGQLTDDLGGPAVWAQRIGVVPVAAVTAAKLRAHGIEKLTDIRARSQADLEVIVGSLAAWLIDLANGRDDRTVEPNRPSKSASAERTYASDLLGLSEIRQEVDRMARDVAGWLRQRAITARTVTIKVRYDDFSTVTRSHSTPRNTDDVDAIVSRALALLGKTEAGARPVRLLGVGVHNLSTDADETVAAGAALRLPFA